MREKKRDFLIRLQSEGRLEEYHSRMATVRKSGMSRAQAHALLFGQYPPLPISQNQNTFAAISDVVAPGNKTPNVVDWPVGMPAKAHARYQSRLLGLTANGKKMGRPRKIDPSDWASMPVKREMYVDKPSPNESEVIRWVFEHWALTDVTPQDAPSAGAWGMLREIRSNPVARGEFFKTIWPKLLPTRSQIEQRERFADDGRDLIGMIDRVRQASMESQ